MNNVAALREEGALPSFLVPTPGNLTAQESLPLGICHPRQKNANAQGSAPEGRRGGGGLGAAGIALEKHYSFRGPINDRISHGIDNTLNETYYTNYHLLICKNRPMVQCH